MKYTELSQRLRLAWRVLRDRDGNLVAHAHRELAHFYQAGDEMDRAMADHLLDMVRVFSAEGHSGFSAGYARHALGKLLAFEPVGPLMGGDSEWQEVGEQDGAPLYQNRRCSRVFRAGDVSYDIDGVVFEEPEGVRYTGRHSRVPVTFPYTPRTVIARVAANATDSDKAMAAQQALIAAEA